jgi:hypothetical protein
MCTCMYAYLCVCVCMYTCMYVCLYACVCVCMCMNRHRPVQDYDEIEDKRVLAYFLDLHFCVCDAHIHVCMCVCGVCVCVTRVWGCVTHRLARIMVHTYIIQYTKTTTPAHHHTFIHSYIHYPPKKTAVQELLFPETRMH